MSPYTDAHDLLKPPPSRIMFHSVTIGNHKLTILHKKNKFLHANIWQVIFNVGNRSFIKKIVFVYFEYVY